MSEVIENFTDIHPERALRSDARRNRERILDAACDLLCRQSPTAISMDDVAHAADIGKGTLYRHFPTREALFEEMLNSSAERLVTAMRDSIPPEADAPTKLAAVVALMLDAHEAGRFNLNLLLAVPEYLAESRNKEPFVEIPRRVRAILDQGVREGSFRPLDTEYATAATLTLISPFAVHRIQNKLGYSRDQLEEQVIDLLLHALRADP